jgi:hypothetical protein
MSMPALLSLREELGAMISGSCMIPLPLCAIFQAAIGSLDERLMFRLVRSLIVCVAFAFLSTAGAQQPSVKSAPIALRDHVPSNDPLATHDLHFDANFARAAIEYSRSSDPNLIERMADSLAVEHILNHGRNFDYDVPKGSRTALVLTLLRPPNTRG